MAPRSSNDRDESSVRDCSWTSYETKAKKSDEPPLTDKTVRFAPTAKVRQVAKFTKEQAKDVWFANEDFQRMKKSFAPTVQRMVAGTLTPEDENSEEHCTRGLEYRTKDGARRRMKNKYDGMAAVLHEQDRQLFEDKHDPEQLAQVYRDINCKCVFEALALGRRDEEDIKAYLAIDNEPIYDSEEEEIDIACSPAAKRLGKLKNSGSFHERSIRGLKRIFSGSKLLRRNPQVTSVAVP